MNGLLSGIKCFHEPTFRSEGAAAAVAAASGPGCVSRVLEVSSRRRLLRRETAPTKRIIHYDAIGILFLRLNGLFRLFRDLLLSLSAAAIGEFRVDQR